MFNDDMVSGASIFGRSVDLIDGDPLEEIFALNLGDFVSEHLISEELANRIGTNVKDKTSRLKNQLQELISIYSLDNTLCVLGFNAKEDYVIYNSIAKTITQMLDMDACHIYLTREFAKGLDETDNNLILVGTSIEFNDDLYAHQIGYKFSDKSFVSEAFNRRDTVEVRNPKGSSRFNPVNELNEDKVKCFTAIPMHNNANVVGVVVIENYTDRFFEDEYLRLIESISKLFATSMSLQREIEQAERLINDELASVAELQHIRAELTALIGDLGDHHFPNLNQINFQQYLTIRLYLYHRNYSIYLKTKFQGDLLRRL